MSCLELFQTNQNERLSAYTFAQAWAVFVTVVANVPNVASTLSSAADVSHPQHDRIHYKEQIALASLTLQAMVSAVHPTSRLKGARGV
jgi:hypothetical protein